MVVIATMEDHKVGEGKKTAYELWRDANVAEVASNLLPVELALAKMRSADAVSRPRRVRSERPPVPARRSLRLGRSLGGEPAREGFRVLGNTGAQNGREGDRSKDHQLIRKSRLAATTTNDNMKIAGS